MIALVASGASASCGHFAKIAFLELQPLSGFQNHSGDSHVYFESGAAAAAADAVVAGLDAAMRRIEASHNATLLHRPKIYICATTERFARHAFTPSSRAETRPFGRTVILQGRVLTNEQRLQAVLTHELSHSFWFQRGIRCHPRWWVEGLAVESSGGGGAEAQLYATAVHALRDGTRFTALEESCWIGDSAMRSGMGWPMFYRQAGMFVGWLRAHDDAAFKVRLICCAMGPC